MNYCDMCHKLKEVKRRGCYLCCDDCWNFIKQDYGDKPRKKRFDLKLPCFSMPFVAACYTEDAACQLFAYTSDVPYIVQLISHESLHFAIHKVAGLEACYAFDVIAFSPKVDTFVRDGVEGL